MLRVLAIVLFAILAAPLASAEPIASLKVAPLEDDGQADGPYYAWINLTELEPPRPAKPQDDCAFEDENGRPPGPDGALVALMEPILAWAPLEEFSFSSWFPTCVATEVGGEGSVLGELARARASYDITTGRYFVAGEAPAGPATPFAFFFATSAAVTGSTGTTIVTDCEGCPPPG